MIQAELNKTIAQMLSTVSDRRRFLEHIAFVRENIYKTDAANTLTKIKERMSEDEFEVFHNIIAHSTSVSSLDSTLVEVETELMKIPVANLTLSYVPTKSQVEDISRTIKSKSNSDILISFQVDYEIGLGAIIDFNGKRTSKTIDEII